MKRARTPDQIQADIERMAKVRAARKSQLNQEPTEPKGVKTEIQEKPDLAAMQRQIDEVMETNTLLKAALLGNQSAEGGKIGVKKGGGLVGEVEKYLVDPRNYPDPTPRLSQESRLIAVNFTYNYELDYRVEVSAYETKTGVNMKEPKFLIQLNRVVLDDQGQQTDKRYIIRKLIFHEDPQAAMIIARENSIEIDEENEKAFLDEMRYLRVRDWLYDLFWPKPAQPKEEIREEVVGGTVVQFFTKNSPDAEGIDFDKLDTKVTL